MPPSRRKFLPVLVSAALLLGAAGCVGTTDPATNVTARTATLNAHGYTNDGPAEWWWEYSSSRSTLEAGGGTRVCGSPLEPDGRCGPAQGGSEQNQIPLSVTIDGLTPDTTYYFRGCGQDLNDTKPGCVNIQSFKTAVSDSGPKPQLRRYPYLTDVVGSSAIVNWATDRSAPTGSLKWGTVSGGSCTTSTVSATRTSITVGSVPEYQWKARITGLAPDTQFCYRVYLGSDPQLDLLGADASPQARSQLAAGSMEPFSFVVFGDWGEVGATGNTDQANLLEEVAESDARFALTTGDNAYPGGSQTNYGDLQQTGAGVSAVFGPSFWKVAGATMPIFPAIGNHGFAGNSHPVNWPQDSAVAASSGTYAASPAPARYWYAFDAGPARFYVLEAAWSDTATQYQDDYNAHWTPTSAEYQWLAADLASHTSTPLKFAFFHNPLYSDQKAEKSDTFLQGAGSLEGLLASNGVDIAFNGHAHIYQRNLDPGADGIISYLTGGGGANLQPIAELGCSLRDAYGIGWSDTSNRGSRCGSAPVPTSRAQVFHFLEVAVDGTRVTVAPTDSLGNSFDVKTYDFSDVQPPSPPSGLSANAVPNDRRVDLNWTASSDPVDGYEVHRRPIGGVTSTLIAITGPGITNYSDTTVAPNTSYEYEVRAFDAVGNTSPPSNAATVTTPPVYFAEADARVEQASPDSNFGTSQSLLVDIEPNKDKKSYLRFTVSGVTGTVQSAKLRLFNFNGSSNGPAVYGTDNGWSETGITWTDRPLATSGPFDDKGSVPVNTWVEFDVSAYVTGNGTYSFLVDPTSTDGVDFRSREFSGTSQDPRLVLTVG